MQKLITTIFLFLITVSFLFLTNQILAQAAEQKPEVVDVYAVFWPIVPGKTVADPMFWAKQLKESFDGLFKFGEVAKSEYQIELSEKRLVEANKLLEDKDYSNAKNSLDLNKAARKEAVNLKKKAQEKNQDVNELILKLVKSLENQRKVLVYLNTQFPEEKHSEIEEMVKELTLQISEAR